MKLYSAQAPNPRRVRIFLAEKGLELPCEELEIGAGGTRAPAFLKKNSLGEAPVLELEDGTIITESVAICRYLEALHPEPPLFGADPVAQGQVEMWSRRLELGVMNPIGQIGLHSFDFFKDKVEQVPAYAEAQRRLALKKLAWLDGEISDGRPFVAGAAFSVADITGMAALIIAGLVRLELPEELGHLRRWADRLRSRPSWEA